MTEPLSAAPIVTGSDWRRAVRRRVGGAWRALLASWPRVLLGVVVGVGVSMAFTVVAGPPAGGAVRGGLAWVVGTTVVTGLVTRLCLVGPLGFARDLRGFPGRIVAIVRDDGSAALAHVLLGFAAGTLITWLLGPALGGTVGIGLFIGLGTFVRPIVVGGAMVLWRWAVSRVSPRNPAVAPMEAMTVSLLGSTGAMALALAIPSSSFRLALGLAAIVAGLLLAGPIAGSERLRILLAVVIAAAGAVPLIDAAGGFSPLQAVWLALFGSVIGLLLAGVRPPIGRKA